jgi:branched-chain amino acid transport system ATP-binding protein
LDEPSLGLAPIVIKDIFAPSPPSGKKRASRSLVEQNARQALAVADRAVLLELGAIALAGKAPSWPTTRA